MERVILHSDLNAFYASVEIMLDPSLREKAVAVCGSTKDRHGIVLAKSEKAKKAHVKTGMANWEAKQLCPDLIMVPPHFEQYLKYSKLVREIYERFTDQVEPYGMDECWLDVTGSRTLFGSGEEIAQQIRKLVYEKLGLTVSIGVSFNKVFAKLGSDLKKPDAVSVVSQENFQETVWPLPASSLLYVGYATRKKLDCRGIHTIGDIAKAQSGFLQQQLGKNGRILWEYANGMDTSPVMYMDYESPVLSIGNGITCTSDLENNEEVWKVMLSLSQDIGHKLRLHGLSCKGVQITIKDTLLSYKQFQTQLPATQSPMEIANKAYELFQANYGWRTYVRAVTVRAIYLAPRTSPQQLGFFDDIIRIRRREKLDDVVESIRRRYGKDAIYEAALMGDIKIPRTYVQELILPGVFRQ